MLTTCLCAVVGASEGASETKPIVRNDTVVLDIDKDFSANKEQLAKLGITDYKDWVYSNEDKCYVLTLDNVHFVTTANVAISLYCENTHEVETETVMIKLVGENTIVSGSEYVFEQPGYKGYCAGILAGSANDDTEVNLIFRGDGKLAVSNNITSKDVIGTSAIVSDGTVAVIEKAVVLANGGNFTHYLDPTKYVEDMRFFSYGVESSNVLVTSALIAVGGNVDLIFPKDVPEDGYKLSIASYGIYADKYAIIDAYVSGVGGEVYFGSAGGELDGSDITSYSAGIAIDEDFKATEYDTYIKDSKVVGTSSWAKGIKMASSCGVQFGAKTNGKVIIEDSIIIGRGDTAECPNIDASEDYKQASSTGVAFNGPTEITGSLIQGASGDLAMVEGGNPQSVKTVLIGIGSKGTMTFKDSIVNASAKGMNADKNEASCGMFAAIQKEGESAKNTDINVIDSEIYASGKSAAILANAVNASLSPRAIYKLDTGSPVTITLKDITTYTEDMSKIVKSIALLYAYDVILDNTLTGITGFHRYTTDSFVVHNYHGYIPEGMQFAGYYILANGSPVNVNVGDVISLDNVKPMFIFATFEVAEKDNGNPVVAWAVVVIALVVVALLAVGVYVWKSRN